jgi:hypothetical protein
MRGDCALNSTAFVTTVKPWRPAIVSVTLEHNFRVDGRSDSAGMAANSSGHERAQWQALPAWVPLGRCQLR